MRLTREFFIPRNAVKVTDKRSGAVAYLYATTRGDPAAAIFYGRQAKPVHRSAFRTEQAREETVRRYFDHRAKIENHTAEKRAERNAIGRKVEVGHILASSWGYEQTNVNFYQVVELVGRTQAIIRAVASMSVGEAGRPGMTDKVVPKVDAFTGEPRKVIIKDGHCKVGHQHASVWSGSPMYTSSYA